MSCFIFNIFKMVFNGLMEIVKKNNIIGTVIPPEQNGLSRCTIHVGDVGSTWKARPLPVGIFGQVDLVQPSNDKLNSWENVLAHR